MLISSAVVVTDAPARYVKQLLSHLGRRITAESLPDDPAGGRLVFPFGTAVLRSGEGRLTLEACAPDAEGLAQVEDVLGRHLERFGARSELAVNWVRQVQPG